VVSRRSVANLSPARAGDHHAIYRLLISNQQRPSAAEFQAQLEDPYYEPTDRLIARNRNQVFAHTLLVQREMHLGRLTVPVLMVNDLVVSPEIRGRGLGSQIMTAIDERMRADNIAVGVLQTTNREFFQARGWHVCLRHSYSTANARKILSHLGEQSETHRPPLTERESPLNIRIWRHVEQAALVDLYQNYAVGAYGPLVRNDAYWRWLISRHGFDQIYIAVQGSGKVDLDDMSPIVGYAVVQHGRILELVAEPSYPRAARELLARACRDAIEHDLHHVRLDAAPFDPLHAVFAAAGGLHQYHEAENDHVFMVRVPDADALLRLLSPQIVQRAKAAAKGLPIDLGLAVGDEKLTLNVDRRRARLRPGRLGRSYLAGDSSSLIHLLLGHLDIKSALEAGRLTASTRVAAETSATLFPQLPVWRPPWDDSPA
jgi:predicted N-acetyltransferase YhbS